MGTLTDTCPKPLLVAGGKALIEWQIERLHKAGINDIVINCGYLGKKIPEYLGNGNKYHVNIAYSMEPEQGLETGGGIVNALPLLGDKPFIVVNSDVWTDFSCKDFSLPDGMLGHLVLVLNPEHNPKGDFALKDNGIVTEMGEDKYTFSGIGIYHPELFRSFTPRFFPLAPVLRSAIVGHKISGEVFYGEWMDVGTPERLTQLDRQLTEF